MILGFYSYYPDQMTKKLAESSRRSLTSILISTSLSFNKTSRIKEANMHFLDHLNSYTSDYKQKLRRLKHVTSLMFSNCMLLQNSAQQLFKANLVRKKRKTKNKKMKWRVRTVLLSDVSDSGISKNNTKKEGGKGRSIEKIKRDYES